ncbi:hypothetical protein CA85_42790 [Allorhodopirellula solitaria]|uniref:Uncharacterized protein n=1 Tax=Allorhodopirellula solitaria TaxID=2527987 RepID=A0A5C5X0J0_9BACT|nr:hypothetical protein CA85_42790 [Allorhodopirellula solitaria]
MVSLPPGGLDRVSRIVISHVRLREDHVAGDVQGVGIGRVVAITGVRVDHPARAVEDLFGKAARTSRHRFDRVADRIEPAIAGDRVADRARVGIDCIAGGLVNPSQVVVLGHTSRDQITAGGSIVAVGLDHPVQVVIGNPTKGIEFPVGVHAAVAPVIGERGGAGVDAIDVRDLTGQVVIAPVIAVVEDRAADLHHIVARGTAAGWVGLGGPSVIGAHKDRDDVVANVVNTLANGAAGRNLQVLPLLAVVAVGCLVVVGPTGSFARGRDGVIDACRRDQAAIRVLPSGPASK